MRTRLEVGLSGWNEEAIQAKALGSVVFGVVRAQQSLDVFNAGEDQHEGGADAADEEHGLKHADCDRDKHTHTLLMLADTRNPA